MFTKIILLTFVIIAFISFADIIQAKDITLEFKAEDIASYSIADNPSQSIYVFRFDIPKELYEIKIESAMLEFYLNVSTTVAENVFRSPLIEVYPLVEEYNGNGAARYKSSCAVRNSTVGDGRRICMDITKVIQEWIEKPESNHGLVLGSLTGEREGIYNIRDDILKNNVVAKLKIFYENRSGGRALRF